MVLLVLLSAGALALGPVALAIFGLGRAAQRWLDALVLVTIVGIAAFHVLPEAFEQCGGRALVAALAGVGALSLIEHLPRRRGRKDGLASSDKLGIVAVATHALLDGAGLALSSGALAAATILHRVPEGIVVWRLARPEKNLPRAVVTVAFVVALNVIGAGIGAYVAPLLRTDVVALVQAFAIGTLVHILFDRSSAVFRRRGHGVGVEPTASDERAPLGTAAVVERRPR